MLVVNVVSVHMQLVFSIVVGQGLPVSQLTGFLFLFFCLLCAGIIGFLHSVCFYAEFNVLPYLQWIITL